MGPLSPVRPTLIATAALLCAGAHAQTCVQVMVHGQGPARGEVVHCPDGAVPGIVDGLGHFCPRDPCDTLIFGGEGLRVVRVAWADVAASGQMELEPVARELAPVNIAPWPSKRDRQALAATSSVDSLAVNGAEEASLHHALAGLPGVRMDERGDGGSSRFSIRGSLLRSPYGTRGVKVYWGPFALTLADGSTPLELLDPMLVGDLDVVRSVGGPVYGSAPSGVLLADAPWRKTIGTTLALDATAGSYGFYKLAARSEVHDTSGAALSVGAYRMDNSGYRDQEATHRDQVFIATRWPHAQGITRAYLTAQQARWGLPGSIDSLTAAQTPRSARAYSQAIDAHIEKQQVFAGLAHEQHLIGPLLLRAAVQAQTIGKLNPYGTTPRASGYKNEQIKGGGTRVSLGATHTTRSVAFAWEAGLEGLLELDHLFEQDYSGGVIGASVTDADTRVANLNTFVTTRTRFGERTTLFADIGTERTGFHIVDALRNSTLTTARTAVAHPLIGVEERLSDLVTAHARYAGTTSRPTIWELLGSESLFNPTLSAESVHESEAGIDLTARDGRWALAVVGYRRTTEGLILQHLLDDGAVTVFQNAGDAHQDGIELAGRFRQGLGAHRLELRLNGAWQQHRLELGEGGPDIDVPGVPRWSGSGALLWRSPQGFGASVEGLFASDVRASTTLDDRVAGYHVLHVRVDRQWKRTWGSWGLFLRVTNVLDERYTAFVQLDDPGRRYYNPAPGRCVYAGISLRFGGAADGGQ